MYIWLLTSNSIVIFLIVICKFLLQYLIAELSIKLLKKGIEWYKSKRVIRVTSVNATQADNMSAIRSEMRRKDYKIEESKIELREVGNVRFMGGKKWYRR